MLLFLKKMLINVVILNLANESHTSHESRINHAYLYGTHSINTLKGEIFTQNYKNLQIYPEIFSQIIHNCMYTSYFIILKTFHQIIIFVHVKIFVTICSIKNPLPQKSTTYHNYQKSTTL